MTDVVFDLYGMPVRQRRDGRGRPEHVWSQENSNKVNLLFATGLDVADVALALGVSQPTLRKHYFSEVSGRRSAILRMTALQLERLNREAAAGNVAAEKALTGMLERERLKVQGDRMAARDNRDKPKAIRPLGKKEQAQLDAGAVSGLYEPPPQASLLN